MEFKVNTQTFMELLNLPTYLLMTLYSRDNLPIALTSVVACLRTLIEKRIVSPVYVQLLLRQLLQILERVYVDIREMLQSVLEEVYRIPLGDSEEAYNETVKILDTIIHNLRLLS